MAKLKEQTITIKISKLVKDADMNSERIVAEDVLESYVDALKEIVGENSIIEISHD